MATPENEGFSPLPALTEPPDPDRELELQDALADDAGTVEESVPPAPLGRAPAYDFIAHRLLPGAAGGPLMTRGLETLATWIEKCLRTRRGESPAVDPDFGCDLIAEDILSEGDPFDAAAIAELTAAAERALLMHPRLTSIETFRIEHDPDDDAVFVTLAGEVDGDDLAEFTLQRLRIGG